MRNCTKGYSCGKTCINRKRSCSKLLTGEGSTLCSSIANFIAPLAPLAPPKIITNSRELRALRNTTESFKQGDLEGTIYVEVVDLADTYITDKEGVYVSLLFSVNQSFDFEGAGSESERLKLGLSMFKSLKKMVSKLPEGTVVHNSPTKDDEREESRARAYQKAGFSAPDSRNDMWGVIENGKIKPITREDILNAVK